MAREVTKPPIKHCEQCGKPYRRKLWKMSKYCSGNCCRKASYARAEKYHKKELTSSWPKL